MTIYPNPSNGHFFIEINYMGGVAQDGQVVITNTYGQVMMSKLVQHNHPVIEVTESSKLTKGIYMVTCTIGNNSFSKKLIIQ